MKSFHSEKKVAEVDDAKCISKITKLAKWHAFKIIYIAISNTYCGQQCFVCLKSALKLTQYFIKITNALFRCQ